MYTATMQGQVSAGQSLLAKFPLTISPNVARANKEDSHEQPVDQVELSVILASLGQEPAEVREWSGDFPHQEGSTYGRGHSGMLVQRPHMPTEENALILGCGAVCLLRLWGVLAQFRASSIPSSGPLFCSYYNTIRGKHLIIIMLSE